MAAKLEHHGLVHLLENGFKILVEVIRKITYDLPVHEGQISADHLNLIELYSFLQPLFLESYAQL
jgi:hypothetical protein